MVIFLQQIKRWSNELKWRGEKFVHAQVSILFESIDTRRKNRLVLLIVSLSDE